MLTHSIHTCGFLLATKVTEGSETDIEDIILVVCRLYWEQGR